MITVYMVVGPAHWIKELMELSYMEWDYKLFLIVLGLAYFAFAWIFEKYLAMRLARVIGHAKQRITGRAKMRKKYKVIREEMWKY